MNGIKTLWCSEVEPFPIRTLKKNFPDAEQLGDIARIDGAKVTPVDIISGGSPCQDMSIAGNRNGLDGERSVLFHQQIRIVKEMREKTNGKYPRFMVWENVPGAFSSNRGGRLPMRPPVNRRHHRRRHSYT
jgi:DNA (cytosine-5)-methyltransferase 1